MLVNNIKEITSSKNNLIKEIKTLLKRKGRIKNKAFIIEGIKIVEEALNKNYLLQHIFYTDQLMEANGGEEIFNRIKYLKNTIYVPDNVFKEISDTENPQGILAIASFDLLSLNEMKKEKPFLLYLDEVQDPGNLGTIIRTADAFNVDGIILTEGCVDAYNPKVVRATMGSIFRVPLYYVENGVESLKTLSDKNINIFATSLSGSKPIYEADFRDGFVLIIGNESKGVSQEIFNLSNSLVKIPMLGETESLNAGVAASIIMYEAMKQRLNIS